MIICSLLLLLLMRFSPEVETDLDQAVAWYDRQERGLGDRFLATFRTAVDRIANFGGALRKNRLFWPALSRISV